ncbi:hypothetical protein CRUP_002185 [Coryphaenoides rupestris]|nr:hypothetical protein CRUP_002185 [Coryphaenoides rupestris]
MTSLGSSSSSATEYTVRVPKNTNKKYSIMAFNAGDKVNCSTWTQEETQDGAAGSEFGKKQREEARRKKYGVVTREFKVEDQPWILKINGKAGKRFKGQKKGGVTENASYYIFTQCPDGAFEAFPVHGWYNFTPQAKHRTLTAEEAEDEWGRRNKVVNHFSIMLQRRLRETEHGGADDDDDEGEKGGKGGQEEQEEEEEEGLRGPAHPRPGGGPGDEQRRQRQQHGGSKKKRKKKGSDHEAMEDSDDGDYEGLEVDYMSDESSSEEEPEAKSKPNKGEDKKRTPPKRGGGRGSGGSSRAGSRPGTPSIDTAATSNTLRAAASKLEQGKRQPAAPSADSPAAKRLKMEPSGQSPAPSGKTTPQPPSGNDVQLTEEALTEEAVRRYLIRKPMTTKDLLKKFQTKRTGLSSEQTVNVLAQILKRLNPERKSVSDKMHFYLTE